MIECEKKFHLQSSCETSSIQSLLLFIIIAPHNIFLLFFFLSFIWVSQRLRFFKFLQDDAMNNFIAQTAQERSRPRTRNESKRRKETDAMGRSNRTLSYIFLSIHFSSFFLAHCALPSSPAYAFLRNEKMPSSFSFFTRASFIDLEASLEWKRQKTEGVFFRSERENSTGNAKSWWKKYEKTLNSNKKKLNFCRENFKAEENQILDFLKNFERNFWFFFLEFFFSIFLNFCREFYLKDSCKFPCNFIIFLRIVSCP